jgi:hypothetical protein
LSVPALKISTKTRIIHPLIGSLIYIKVLGCVFTKVTNNLGALEFIAMMTAAVRNKSGIGGNTYVTII